MCQFLPQLLLFLALFGANLYLMCHISVGLDQELALPEVSGLFSVPETWQRQQCWGWNRGRGGNVTRLGSMQSCSQETLREKPNPHL